MAPSRKTWRQLSVSVALFCVACSLQAAQVRGRIQASGTGAGMAGLRVTLVPAGGTEAKNVRSAAAYTDTSGMFWIEDVRPGSYDLEVWTKDGGPRVYRIEVKEPVLNVAPITLGGP